MRPYVTTCDPFRGHTLQNPWDDENSYLPVSGLFPRCTSVYLSPSAPWSPARQSCASEEVSQGTLAFSSDEQLE